jgi:Zn finger protein HypA/HybF involved in hydrogenase expression
MSTVAPAFEEGNIVAQLTRADLVPHAVRQFYTIRRMELYCYNCGKTTRRNVQALRHCPQCGIAVRIVKPGRPHRKVKVVTL